MKKITVFFIFLLVFINKDVYSNENFYSFEGHVYEYVPEGMSWSEALEFALNKGGYLVEINSFQENIFIKNLLSDVETTASDGGEAKYSWLGGSFNQDTNLWEWNNGRDIQLNGQLDRPLWGNGPGFVNTLSEPDQSIEDQNCLSMGAEMWPKESTENNFLGKKGQWNDLLCTNLLSFIIEYNTEAIFSDNTFLELPVVSIADQSYKLLLQYHKCGLKDCFMILSTSKSYIPLNKHIASLNENELIIPRVRIEDNEGANINNVKFVEMTLTFDQENFTFEKQSSVTIPSLNTYPGQTKSFLNTDDLVSSEWVLTTPNDVGIKQEGIDKAMDYAFKEDKNTRSVLIVKNGSVVAERYSDGNDKDTISTSWSTAKSFISALIGIAIDKNQIQSVDIPASDFITEWKNTDKSLLSIKDFLQMSSTLLEIGDDGLLMYVGFQSFDGSYILLDNLEFSINRVFNPVRKNSPYKWNYQNADTQILGEIIERASNESIYSYAQKNLFSKINIKADWWKDGFNNYMAYCCLDMTSRDFAKFGLLFARDGRWFDGDTTNSEQQIVSKEYVIESTSPSVLISQSFYLKYGYQWWVDTSGDWFVALGYGSNNIYVHPGLDLVVVRNSETEFNNDGPKERTTNYKLSELPKEWNHREFFIPIIESAEEFNQ